MKLTRQKASAKEATAPIDPVRVKPPVRVVVIDDHEMIVQSLVRLLTADAKIEVVGTSLNAVEGIDIAARLRPDVVVIDYHLPDMDAPQAIKMLLEMVPGAKVVTLTGSESPSSYYVSMSSGSSAWVAKTNAIQELRTAILNVAAGQVYKGEGLEPRPLDESPPVTADAELRHPPSTDVS
jgi:DNA-binding NarL/FixJ family response regulator